MSQQSAQPISPNVVWHGAKVTRERREQLHQHRGAVLWFTGLPSAGKSTVANELDDALHRMGLRSYVLDGDNVRHGLCGDLGFTDQDREENIRRVTEVARLFLDAGTIVMGAFVSPIRRDRERARSLFRHGDFLEIYCRCPLDVCEDRDPKGLYRRALLGVVKNFTGVSAPYEEPINPELVLDTGTHSVQHCVQQLVALLREREIIGSEQPLLEAN